MRIRIPMPPVAMRSVDVVGSGTATAFVMKAISSMSGAPVPVAEDESEKLVIVCPVGATNPKKVSPAPLTLSIVAVSVTDPPPLKLAIAVTVPKLIGIPEFGSLADNAVNPSSITPVSPKVAPVRLLNEKA